MSENSHKPNLAWKLDTIRGMTQVKHLPEIVGKGYKDFWTFRGRYRVVKGSRSSKKSKTTALNFIFRLHQYPKANLLVIRKTERTLMDSCFKELLWAIRRLGVDEHWKASRSPLQITNTVTGQMIYFRGLDSPLKITSITVEVGQLCWMWIEEAYEIMRESDFDTIDESIRGATGDGLFKQITLTFNPWNERSWLKRRFFDVKDDLDILAMTTNYTINEWLDDADQKLFDRMKKHNPRRYQVAGLGNWGISEGLVYENWQEVAFDIDKIRATEGGRHVYGLDWGYSNDPTALFCGMFFKKKKQLYVFDELYLKSASNEVIAVEIKKAGYHREKIVADSAEPKSIDRLKILGIYGIRGSKKGADSVRFGIDAIQDYEIIVHPRCVNFLTEISNYKWARDKFDQPTGQPDDDFNHLMDAMRYAVEAESTGKVAFALDRRILGI